MNQDINLLQDLRPTADLDTGAQEYGARLLKGAQNTFYLLWEGPRDWAREVERLYGCGELEALPRPLERKPMAQKEQILLRCLSPRPEPFDIWRWRSLPHQQAVDALSGLARTLQTIHDGGYTLEGIRRNELLLDTNAGRLILATLPRLRPLDDDPETIWRDIRIFAELAYENFLKSEYPGGHQLVETLQNREAMASEGIIFPGLSQLMAGCVTPYGDLAYSSADELLEGLEHLELELEQPLQYRAASSSTQGNHIFRQNNQDSCGQIILDTICGSKKIRQGFFCVADGIGGIEDGERASALAVRTACATFFQAWNHYGSDAIYRSPVTFARAIAQITSQRLALEGDFSPRRNRGGTTFTGLLLVDDQVGICHVGDSRAVLIRNKQLIPLTTPHTLATILERLGELPTTDDDGTSHRTISRFFSTGSELELERIDSFSDKAITELTRQGGLIDERGLRAQPGDIFILTSDGAHDEINDDELLKLALTNSENPQQLCDAILKHSLERIGRDNATALAILIE